MLWLRKILNISEYFQNFICDLDEKSTKCGNLLKSNPLILDLGGYSA
jgi:hypothetical protein